MNDAEQIARGLVGNPAIAALSDEWRAGPDLPDDVIDHLLPLREAGLVEREFADWIKNNGPYAREDLRIEISACWWFRLTPLGLAVRKILMEQTDGQG